MQVYVVGIKDCEGRTIQCVCRSYATARCQWNLIRRCLRRQCRQEMQTGDAGGLAAEHLEALTCTDPAKIDCYPMETPYIVEAELLE